MTLPSSLQASPAWQALARHFDVIQSCSMRRWFDVDPNRFARFQCAAAGLFLDYSKNRITEETLKLLLNLAVDRGIQERREQMFSGEKINITEHRAAWHTALRHLSGQSYHSSSPTRGNKADDEAVRYKVDAVRERMLSFAESVREGRWRGYTGKYITDVVNIGIGGSDLGPLMVCQALHRFGHDRLKMHFVSTVDGDQITTALKALNPETTLFIVASKTFTTQETLTNAHTARSWFLATASDEKAIAQHFVAVSTNNQAVTDFGIDKAQMFEFWDWVGGRYSLWSAIGLPIAVYLGRDAFLALLAGAEAMDRHFVEAPLESNMPVILGMLGIWYINFFGAQTHLISPYNQSMARFPAYLQQLDMESNGKTVDLAGHKIDYQTGPVVWGDSGINGQHAYYQLLHQGRQFIPIDFIAAIHQPDIPENHARILMANFFAQTEALMKGKNEAEVRSELFAQGLKGEELETLVPHKIFEGNRPTNTLLMDRLCPATLGALIALYEHKIFVQGTVWNINSYDQWGVELGKQLAKTIEKDLASSGMISRHDSSTDGLIRRYKAVLTGRQSGS